MTLNLLDLREIGVVRSTQAVENEIHFRKESVSTYFLITAVRF